MPPPAYTMDARVGAKIGAAPVELVKLLLQNQVRMGECAWVSPPMAQGSPASSPATVVVLNIDDTQKVLEELPPR
jgi:hypothetical protein